uniref:Uncharacterized protein n=1 Tax=Coccidioides posadasii RMSCC 3488 TaxID=454284 RepID=A0A0J6F6Z5_COCPO|nr:hypothetical protein CPAG_01407 [Coccidioides posadasii RMSCC 3488]
MEDQKRSPLTNVILDYLLLGGPSSAPTRRRRCNAAPCSTRRRVSPMSITTSNQLATAPWGQGILAQEVYSTKLRSRSKKLAASGLGQRHGNRASAVPKQSARTPRPLPNPKPNIKPKGNRPEPNWPLIGAWASRLDARHAVTLKISPLGNYKV